MLLGRDLHWMMCNEARGGILAPQISRNEPIIWHFPSKTSKVGQIHVKFTQLFKRPLNGLSRRVHSPPQTPQTTAHNIEPIVKPPSQPSLTQLAAHRRTSLLPLRNVNPQPMNGNPPLAPPPARGQGPSAPPRDILPSWTLLDGERTTEIPQKAPLEQDVASGMLTYVLFREGAGRVSCCTLVPCLCAAFPLFDGKGHK